MSGRPEIQFSDNEESGKPEAGEGGERGFPSDSPIEVENADSGGQEDASITYRSPSGTICQTMSAVVSELRIPGGPKEEDLQADRYGSDKS